MNRNYININNFDNEYNIVIHSRVYIWDLPRMHWRSLWRRCTPVPWPGWVASEWGRRGAQGAGREEGGVEVLQVPGQVGEELEGNASELLDPTWPLGSLVEEGWVPTLGPLYWSHWRRKRERERVTYRIISFIYMNW